MTCMQIVLSGTKYYVKGTQRVLREEKIGKIHLTNRRVFRMLPENDS